MFPLSLLLLLFLMVVVQLILWNLIVDVLMCDSMLEELL